MYVTEYFEKFQNEDYILQFI